MASIQHGFAPANANLNCLDSDQSYFDDANYDASPPPVQSSPLSFSAEFDSSSSSAAAPTPAFATPNLSILPTQQHSPLINSREPLFGETFTLDADSETSPAVVVPPPTATISSAVDPLPPAFPPSSYELQPVARAPITPKAFVAAAFAPSASSQSVPITPLATIPGNDSANFSQPVYDAGHGKSQDLNLLVTKPTADLVPEVNDVNADAPPSFGTIQSPIMEPLPTLPVLASVPALESAPAEALATAPAPRRQHNPQQTAKVTAEEVTTEVTADAKAVPAKRKPGRPKLPEGAPKAPYKKRSVPTSPPTTPPKPKRAYKKQVAAMAD